ncbi:MAG: DMT family transporter [Pseudomonadota bacterium]
MARARRLSRVGAVWVGVALALLFTLVAAVTDAIVKHFANAYEAPQLFVFSGVLICVFCVFGAVMTGESLTWRTACPRAMALRSVLACVAVVGYYYAFRALDFAEVFLFIGLAPLLSGVAAGPVLGERVGVRGWVALCGGALGVGFLYPSAADGKLIGYCVALVAVFAGTLSIVLSRYISLREHRPMLLIFYPNLAIGLAMAVALPFVYEVMPLRDGIWVCVYAIFMFASRWLLIEAVKLVPAYFISLMVNTQFAWMVIIGAVIFSEWPSAGVFAGALILIGASLLLVKDQLVAASNGKPLSGVAALK